MIKSLDWLIIVNLIKWKILAYIIYFKNMTIQLSAIFLNFSYRYQQYQLLVEIFSQHGTVKSKANLINSKFLFWAMSSMAIPTRPSPNQHSPT